MVTLILLIFFSQLEVRITKRFDPFKWQKLKEKYNIKSYILGNVEIDLRNQKLIPVKITEEPSIPKFTLSVAREYYDKDVFKGLAGLAILEVPYRITILPPIGLPHVHEGIAEIVMGVDYRWKRVVFGVKGGIDLYAFGAYGEGAGKWLYPWDIETSFPYVYVTDPDGGKVCVWKAIIDTFPNGDYWFTGFSFYKDIGENVLGQPTGIGIYRNDPYNPDDDLIYIADLEKARIFTFDKEGNLIRVFGKSWGCWKDPPPGYFSFPYDVEVDPEGNVYVIEYPGDYLIAYRDTFISDKPFYWRFFSFRPHYTGFPSHLSGLAIDANRNVYVGWHKYDNQMHLIDCKIIRFYPELSDSEWSYGTKGTGLGQFPEIRDIYIKGSFLGVTEDWGEDRGLAYFLIPDVVNDTIPPTAKFISPPDSTYVNGEIPFVINVYDETHLKGYRIYYADFENPNELSIILEGTEEGKVFAGYWDTQGLEEGLYFFYLEAFDFANNIAEDTLLLYIGEPYPKIYFGIFGKEKGEFRLPCDLVVDSQFIYVCDTQNDRVQKFDKNGNFIFSFGDKTLFNQPGGVDFDKNGNIYVSDIHNHKIHKFSPDGNYISSFGEYGSEPGKLNQPHGIFIIDSLIYIADRQNNRIQIFNLNGEFIIAFGGEGEERGKFKHPYDLVLDTDTSLYVSDQHNNRIQKFDKFGNVLLTIYGDKLPDSLKQPAGLSVDDKYFYIADMHKHRIIVYPLKISQEDPLSMYKVKPGDILIFPNPSKGKIYFVINVPKNENT